MLQNSNEFLNLIPATYQIYIEDAQGCDFTESVIITEGTTLSVTIESPQEMLCENETLLLSTPDIYTDYNWSISRTTPEISIDTAGVYTLVVTDEMGCTAMDEITINLIPQDTIRIKEQTCDPEQLQPIITTNLETDGCQDITITSYELIPKDTTYLNNTTCNSIDAGTSSELFSNCLLYTSPSPRDATLSRMPSSA